MYTWKWFFSFGEKKEKERKEKERKKIKKPLFLAATWKLSLERRGREERKKMQLCSLNIFVLVGRVTLSFL